MPYTVRIKDGDSHYEGGTWTVADDVGDYLALEQALIAFLVGIEDGYTPVTLKFKASKNKEGNK